MVYVAKESTKALHQKWQYLKEYESWLNICTSFSFILISFHNNPFAWKENNIEMGRWQYHVNGIGVFTTWLLQMFLIGRVPRFGLYVEIFKKVSKTFINFFLAFVFLFVAFACSFLALFPEHRAFSSSSPAVLIKVMVMMLGELEYDDLLHPLNLIERTNGSTTTIDEVDQFIHFPFASVVMVAIFILLVSFIIMNLLFGLAVADIQVNLQPLSWQSSYNCAIFLGALQTGKSASTYPASPINFIYGACALISRIKLPASMAECLYQKSVQRAEKPWEIFQCAQQHKNKESPRASLRFGGIDLF